MGLRSTFATEAIPNHILAMTAGRTANEVSQLADDLTATQGDVYRLSRWFPMGQSVDLESTMNTIKETVRHLRLVAYRMRHETGRFEG